jgi:glutamate/tyrosine decarboxylase-like PLP-dependent enzyme
MSGTRITDKQVRLYMSKRKHHSLEVAAAKAGISVRTARRIDRDARLALPGTKTVMADPN